MPINPADEKPMEEQGFPKAIQDAFKNTAEETQCVILSRVPGGATTELIKAGHDLKGYFIKAKSCDWGPMSGFLCQVPAFNKKGVDGIEHNAEQNLYYYKKFCDRLHGPQEGLDPQDPSTAEQRIKSILTDNKLKWQEQWNAPLLGTTPIVTTRAFLKDKSDETAVANLSVLVGDMDEVFIDNPSGPINKSNPEFSKRLNTVVRDLRTLVGDDSPFVPLKLTKKVFEEFKRSFTQYTETIGDITCGVAYKKMVNKDNLESYVWFKYIVKKEGTLYELYHGDVWVYDDKKPSLLENYVRNELKINEQKQLGILGIPTSDSQDGRTINDLCGDKAQEVLDEIEKKFQDEVMSHIALQPRPAAKELFCPIRGIQNYYPPFSGDDAYKNVVTGDYDLFACWPKISSGGLEDLVRWSERGPTGDGLFSRMSSKQFSLRSTVSRNVIVEFTPSQKFQHPSFGNSNGLVLLIAGTLNSLVAAGVARGGRNVAFHGDEGGRPEIDAVEYPVAAFVPKALMAAGSVARDLTGQEADKKNAQMFLITNHVDLLTLINAVKCECYVPLNFAWVYDFLTREKHKVKVKKQNGEEMTDEKMNIAVKDLLKTLFYTPPKNAKAATNEEEKKQDAEHATLQTKFKALFPAKVAGKFPEKSAFFVKADQKIDFVMNPDANAKAPTG
jgi:hypothetical protein